MDNEPHRECLPCAHGSRKDRGEQSEKPSLQSPTAHLPAFDAWAEEEEGFLLWLPLEPGGPAQGVRATLTDQPERSCILPSQFHHLPWGSATSISFLTASSASKEALCKEPSLGLKCSWECDNGIQALTKGLWPPMSPRSNFQGVEFLSSVPPGLPSAPQCGLQVSLRIGITYSA